MSSSPADSAQVLDHAFSMAAMPITTARINKFAGTNFHTWKFKMQMVLEERDLWDVVSGEVKLEHCVSTLDKSTFKRKSHKALAIVCLAMEDSQLPQVRSAEMRMMHGRVWRDTTIRRALLISYFFVAGSSRQ